MAVSSFCICFEPGFVLFIFPKSLQSGSQKRLTSSCRLSLIAIAAELIFSAAPFGFFWLLGAKGKWALLGVVACSTGGWGLN